MTDKITSGQTNQISALATATVAEATKNLSKEEAQKIIANGGDFQAQLKLVLEEIIQKQTVSDIYANEETESTYDYLSGYKKPGDLSDQLDTLKKAFPNIDFPEPNQEMFDDVINV